MDMGAAQCLRPFWKVSAVVRVPAAMLPPGIGCRLWEVHPFMLHFTCDLCGKEMLNQQESRYVVKIEVFAAHDPREITEADLDEDHMEAVSQLLHEMEDNVADPDLAAPSHK